MEQKQSPKFNSLKYTKIRVNQYLEKKVHNSYKKRISQFQMCICGDPLLNPYKKNLDCDKDCLNFKSNIECYPEICSIKKNICSNRKFKNQQYKKLKIFEAGRKGRGIKAKQLILQGEFIIEYIGQVFDIRTQLGQLQLKKIQDSKVNYTMKIDKFFYIDASQKGNLSRFINHSCNPNAITWIFEVQRKSRIGIFSLRTIHIDQEITYDYRFSSETSYMDCLCGAQNCKGFIGKQPKDIISDLYCYYCQNQDKKIMQRIILCDMCNRGMHKTCYQKQQKQSNESNKIICKECEIDKNIIHSSVYVEKTLVDYNSKPKDQYWLTEIQNFEVQNIYQNNQSHLKKKFKIERNLKNIEISVNLESQIYQIFSKIHLQLFTKLIELRNITKAPQNNNVNSISKYKFIQINLILYIILKDEFEVLKAQNYPKAIQKNVKNKKKNKTSKISQNQRTDIRSLFNQNITLRLSLNHQQQAILKEILKKLNQEIFSMLQSQQQFSYQQIFFNELCNSLSCFKHQMVLIQKSEQCKIEWEKKNNEKTVIFNVQNNKKNKSGFIFKQIRSKYSDLEINQIYFVNDLNILNFANFLKNHKIYVECKRQINHISQFTIQLTYFELHIHVPKHQFLTIQSQFISLMKKNEQSVRLYLVIPIEIQIDKWKDIGNIQYYQILIVKQTKKNVLLEIIYNSQHLNEILEKINEIVKQYHYEEMDKNKIVKIINKKNNIYIQYLMIKSKQQLQIS